MVLSAWTGGLMSYIERSLGDGEQSSIRARFHWLYNLRAWLALIVPSLARARDAIVALRR